MLSYEEIMDYCSNYKIDNGVVIDKRTNKQVIDEETILKVKSSILLFKEAKEAYQSDIKQFGKTTKTQEWYIKKNMEKFGVNNEENVFGVNKLINALLSSNGHYEEYMSGDDLFNSKFSILVGSKKEYGLAYLKLKFREKGLDIEELKVSQDLSELHHNGVSKVIIDFKLKKYQKENKLQNENDEQQETKPLLQHPKAQELNELEQKKQLAKQSGDQAAVNYYQSEIEKIVKENELVIDPNEWDQLSDDEKMYFYKIKMKEAKTLRDEVSYNYWSANLKMLQERMQNKPELQQVSALASKPNTADASKQEQPKDFRYYYDEMMKVIKQYNPSVSLTEEQKKQFIGEIFYNETCMIEKISSNDDIQQLMTLIVSDLGNNEIQRRLSNIILAELQEKHKELNPINQQDVTKIQANGSSTSLISGLRNELRQIRDSYHEMLADGHIDDEELATLTNMLDKVIRDGYSLKDRVTSQSDVYAILSIIKRLEEEKRKMTHIKQGIEEIERSL